MNLIYNELYKEDIKFVAGLNLPWEKLNKKSILISGATGLIGSFLIDVIMERNKCGMNTKVYALGRNIGKSIDRFSYCINSRHYEFIPCDISKSLVSIDIGNVDYVLHLASNTHPLQYSCDPIGTIMTNVLGTYNMLEFARLHNASRCVFASSNEIYGENRGDVELFDESYCGYIDSNTLRAGYPESKRCGEALCQAYIRQKGLDIVIPRLTRSYGPTMLMNDTKAISQFIKNCISGDEIVLKSSGNQQYSYTYVVDAVSGLLTVWLKGLCGECYNIADEKSDIKLKEIANIIANYSKKEVVFEKPSEIESQGYSIATKARLDSGKLRSLGWNAKYGIKEGLCRTLDILKDCMA